MNILAIGAHADDPETSMGGTIAKFVQHGHDVKILIAIIPCEDVDGIYSKERKERRWKECENSAKILGAELEIIDLDPYEMWFRRDIVKILNEKIKDFAPAIVYTHWDHDSHQDHVAIANATFAATRKNNVSLMMYEQLTLGGITPYSFKGHAFVDISKEIEVKMESLKTYQSQVPLYNRWIDAIKGLATFRGRQIGVEYAEAFEIVRVLLNVNDVGCLVSGVW